MLKLKVKHHFGKYDGKRNRHSKQIWIYQKTRQINWFATSMKIQENSFGSITNIVSQQVQSTLNLGWEKF